MKYNCSDCIYETDDQSNYNKHLKSKKHIALCNKAARSQLNIILSSPSCNPTVTIKKEINQQQKYVCADCSLSFAYRQGLSRHRKTCSKLVVPDNDKDKRIAELEALVQLEKQKKQTEILQLKLKYSENENKLLKKNNNTLSTVAENNSMTSCSAMNFVMKNYKNAPCIQKFDEYQLLLEGNEEYSIAEVVINKYEKKEFVQFIGDILIKKYKTENPEDRSMWSSDTARLAYMIRELSVDNVPAWFHDKGGVKTANYTVKPILAHIKDDLKRLVKENTQALGKVDFDDLNNSECDELRKNILVATEILQLIAKSDFTQSVIKYIAGHFYLDRKPLQKQLTHEKTKIIKIKD
jgi:hypothetical protein